jgi:hypothetical protein
MSVQKLALLSTRIVDFKINPTRVAVGETVTITGTLQWHTPILCWWNALEGATVEIIADTAKLGEVTTGSGGGFRFTWTPTAVGTYYVKARFPGDWVTYNPCESQTIKVEVITPEQKQQEQMYFLAMVGIGAAATVTIIGLILYYTFGRR